MFLQDPELNCASQQRYIKNPLSAITNESPTLLVVDTAFGEGTSTDWIMAELEDLSEYCGCSNKFTTDQMEQTGDFIKTRYKNLKITELLLFFGWLKSGKYGKFYGALDPIFVMESLIEFNMSKARMLKQIEFEKGITRTYEEWKAGEERRKEWAKYLCEKKSKNNQNMNKL